jgi:hypothetical protein
MKNPWGWRAGTVVRICCSCGGPKSPSSKLYSDSQSSITSLPWVLAHYSGFSDSTAHIRYTYTHVGKNTHTHKTNKSWILQYSRKTPRGVEQKGVPGNGGLSSSESLYLAPLIKLTILCGDPQQPLSYLRFWPQWLAFYSPLTLCPCDNPYP